MFPILDPPSTRAGIGLGVFARLHLDPEKRQRRRLVQLQDEVPFARLAGGEPVLVTQVLNDSRTVQSDLKLIDNQLAEKAHRRWSGLSKSDYRTCLVLIQQEKHIGRPSPDESQSDARSRGWNAPPRRGHESYYSESS